MSIKRIFKKITPSILFFFFEEYNGYKKRKDSLAPYAVSAGKNVFLSKNCKFGNGIILGNDIDLYETEVGDYSYFSGQNISHNCIIGKYSSIAPGVRLGLGEHPITGMVSTHPAFFADKKQKRLVYAPDSYSQEFEQFKKIIVGNDVWIGQSVIVKGGVTIGDGAIIGAGAVVTQDVKPYAIVGGVPAKLIRYRFNSKQIDFLLRFKWWDRSDKWLRENWEQFWDIDSFIKEHKKIK